LFDHHKDEPWNHCGDGNDRDCNANRRKTSRGVLMARAYHCKKDGKENRSLNQLYESLHACLDI
jgi:hypothetical protein